MKTNTKISSMIRTISLISIILLMFSCTHRVKKHVYKASDGSGYVFQNENDVWYIMYYNSSTGDYDCRVLESEPSYDVNSYQSVEFSSDNVSNFSEMSESTGQDVGGSEAGNVSDGSGMSESSGSDCGGSDGGGDGGGGD